MSDGQGHYIQKGWIAHHVTDEDLIWFPHKILAEQFVDHMNAKLAADSFKSTLIRWGIKTDEAKPEPEIIETVIESDYRVGDLPDYGWTNTPKRQY